jgi:hypothetical protein
MRLLARENTALSQWTLHYISEENKIRGFLHITIHAYHTKREKDTEENNVMRSVYLFVLTGTVPNHKRRK